ncbi:MAG: histidinol-phosphate transaminase, partial [Solirubrobacteraceae bacterium]
ASSDANFIWVHLPEDDDPADQEKSVVTGLAQRGVLVRAGTSLGQAGALRVTVGVPEENRRFIAAMRELL